MLGTTRRPVILLAIGQTLAWASIYYTFPALLLRWEQDMGWSKPEVTMAITLGVLISALMAPVAGRIIDAGRGGEMMAGAAVLGGALLVVLSRVETLWQFYLVWGGIGVAMSGALYEPCFALVTRAKGAGAKGSIVLITLVAGFASTISFPAVHAVAEAGGWRAAVLMAAVVVTFGSAPLHWIGGRALEAGRVEEPVVEAATPAPRRAFLRRAAFWYLATGFSMVALVHGATLHHLLSYLDERGLSPETAVLAASFIGPMQVAGRLAMMMSEKYISHHGVALTAFALIAASVALLWLGQGAPVTLSGFVMLFASAYGTVSILRPLITRDILGGRDFGSKSGALALPYLIGSASAPWLGAVVWRAGGYGLMFAILIGLMALGCGLYLAAHNRAGRDSAKANT